MFLQDSYKYFYKFMKVYEMLFFSLNIYWCMLYFKKYRMLIKHPFIFPHTVKPYLKLKLLMLVAYSSY